MIFHMPKQLAGLMIAVVICLGLMVEMASGGDDAGPVEYAVIVNASNTFADDASAKSVIKQLFLKDREEWPNKAKDPSKPFGRAAGSPESKAFLAEVLGMTEAELAKHWISLKQKTGQTPPREVAADGMLIRFVAKFPGGFGVVKADAAQADGVKVLFTFKH